MDASSHTYINVCYEGLPSTRLYRLPTERRISLGRFNYFRATFESSISLEIFFYSSVVKNEKKQKRRKDKKTERRDERRRRRNYNTQCTITTGVCQAMKNRVHDISVVFKHFVFNSFLFSSQMCKNNSNVMPSPSGQTSDD